MTIDKIYNELQLINEFEANFNITPQSKTSRLWLYDLSITRYYWLNS